MKIQELLDLRTDAFQKYLFAPVVMNKVYSNEDEIVQFTDTAFIDKHTGDVVYLVEFGIDRSHPLYGVVDPRYGFVVSGFEPDSDGGFEFSYLYEIENNTIADYETAEDFLKSYELVLGVTHEVVKIINRYVERKNRY
jgi:hypothetical protein